MTESTPVVRWRLECAHCDWSVTGVAPDELEETITSHAETDGTHPVKTIPVTNTR